MLNPGLMKIAMAESRLTPGMVSRRRIRASDGARGRFDAPVGDRGPDGVVVELLQEVAQDPLAVRVELEAQGIAESAELLADMPAQPRQHGLPRRAGNEAFENAPTVDAMGDPAEDAADADAVPVKDLLRAKLLLSSLFDECAAIPAQPRRSRKVFCRIRLGLARPNWQMRDSQTLSAMSVLQPLICLTCCAWTTMTSSPVWDRTA